MLDHDKFMHELIQYTYEADKEPYTACIVDSEGNTLVQAVGNKDTPINHAEILAINLCASQYPDIAWNSLTLYSSGEPCCMCAAASCWANLKSVVYSVDIPYMNTLWGVEGSLSAREVIKSHPKKPALIESVCQQSGYKLFAHFKERFAKTWNEKRWEIDVS